MVITNVALDHIGLVKSVDEIFEETSGAVKALKKRDSNLILNSDDPLVKSMAAFTPNAHISFFGHKGDVEHTGNGIAYKGEILLDKDELPFKSDHFIQNIMAAMAAVLSINVDLEDSIGGH